MRAATSVRVGARCSVFRHDWRRRENLARAAL